MQHVYTVKQVNAYIKNMFTQDFMLNRIAVKGEVSNCKYHSSGHIYFSLKDASGVIACVMFAGNRGGLAFRMTEGQQVIVMGSVSTYERDGDTSSMQERSGWTEKVFCTSGFRRFGRSLTKWGCLLRNINSRFPNMFAR